MSDTVHQTRDGASEGDVLHRDALGALTALLGGVAG